MTEDEARDVWRKAAGAREVAIAHARARFAEDVAQAEQTFALHIATGLLSSKPEEPASP